MARLPLFVDDPGYHDLFERFAFDVGAELADALLDKKVVKEIAHETVAAFVFNFAMLFDGRTRSRTAAAIALKDRVRKRSRPGDRSDRRDTHELGFDIVEHMVNVDGRC